MKIAFLTTWNVRCGIASYTQFLTDALVKQGHEVTILCQYDLKDNKEDFGEGYNVVKCFEWYGMNNKVKFDIDLINKVTKGYDIFHIQYESFLYHKSYLDGIFGRLTNPVQMVVTHHSSCTGSDCPVRWSANICHDEDFPQMENRYVLPMGIPDLSPVKNIPEGNTFGSFGLARNNDALCKQILGKLNEGGFECQYETHYGSSKWVPMDELAKTIQKWRAIVLLYPPTDANVSSSAVCVAIGTGIPVICTDTRWFQHAKDFVHLITTPTELEFLLGKYLSGDEAWWADHRQKVEKALDERSWDTMAKKHIEIYQTITR